MQDTGPTLHGQVIHWPGGQNSRHCTCYALELTLASVIEEMH